MTDMLICPQSSHTSLQTAETKETSYRVYQTDVVKVLIFYTQENN
jgi:hypothetical protein